MNLFTKCFTALLFCSAVVFASYGSEIRGELEDEFRLWKKLYNKQYETVEEDIMRFGIWLNNWRLAVQHNLEAELHKHSYTMGVNKYSDLTNHEVTQTMNGYLMQNKKVNSTRHVFGKSYNRKLPEHVDWRDKGYVTNVKDQGQCGSCWSFSATGSLEGQHFKKSGDLVSLSEQNLVDCSGDYGNMGCNGGLMDDAFQYIKAKGVDTEESYPYVAEQQTCHWSKANVGAKDTGFTDVTAGDEKALQEAVATVGPVSVAIDASHFTFQLYRGGIYNEPECSSQSLDHGVLVVGYGSSEKGEDYWIVKNSWGSSWGENGYIRMSRNKNNQCGIATSASYPDVSASNFQQKLL